MPQSSRKKAHVKARAAINALVKVLNKGDETACLVWDVVTALRGPDDSSDTLKQLTTARIRGAIDIKSNFVDAIDLTPSWAVAIEMHPHFGRHYYSALEALTKLGYIADVDKEQS